MFVKNPCARHPAHTHTHTHRCGNCDTQWGHTQSSGGCEACHTCPECGETQWVKDWVSDQERANHKRDVVALLDVLIGSLGQSHRD